MATTMTMRYESPFLKVTMQDVPPERREAFDRFFDNLKRYVETHDIRSQEEAELIVLGMAQKSGYPLSKTPNVTLKTDPPAAKTTAA